MADRSNNWLEELLKIRKHAESKINELQDIRKNRTISLPIQSKRTDSNNNSVQKNTNTNKIDNVNFQNVSSDINKRQLQNTITPKVTSNTTTNNTGFKEVDHSGTYQLHPSYFKKKEERTIFDPLRPFVYAIKDTVEDATANGVSFLDKISRFRDPETAKAMVFDVLSRITQESGEDDNTRYLRYLADKNKYSNSEKEGLYRYLAEELEKQNRQNGASKSFKTISNAITEKQDKEDLQKTTGLIDFLSDKWADNPEAIENRQFRMRSNIESNKTEIGKKLTELAGGMGTTFLGMAGSVVNPILGTALFSTSAAGGYYKDGRQRGMSFAESMGYASAMAGAESLTEKYITGDMVSKAKKLSTGTGLNAKVLQSFGVNIAENYVQEALTEPISEVVAYAVGGKDSANFDNVFERMMSSGLDGLLSATILAGASAGVGSAVGVMQKGTNVTQAEMAQACNDTIKSGKVDVDEITKGIVEGVKEKVTKYKLSDIIDTKNNNINDVTAPIKRYEYQETDNVKINNLRQDMSKYWRNTKEAKALGSVMEKIISDKGYNIRLDNIINKNGKAVNGQITTLDNGEVEIRINPNSKNAGEFLLMHEVTHAIETKEMTDLIMNYASKSKEFNNALEDLKQTYGTNEITSEVVADISGQLFGNQEFINNLSIKKPNVFKRIYGKIIEIANKMTGNSKEALFIRDLKNKWERAYRTQNNNMREEKGYHISNDFSSEIDKALNNQLPSNTQIKARDYTPKILVDNGASNLPMLITQKHIKSTIYTLQQAQQLKLPVKNINYHGLGKDLLIKAIDNLDNPRAIYKKSNNEYLIVTELKNQKNEDIIVPILLNGKGNYNNIIIDENHIKSVYGKNSLQRYLNNNNFELIYNKKEASTLNEGIQYSDIGNNASKTSILPTKTNVNRNTTKYSMQESENNSGSFNLPTKNWSEHLNENYKTTGTRTNLEDVKLPTKQYFERKEKLISIPRTSSNSKSFAEQVDNYLNKKMPSSELMYLGNTPSTLKKLGLKDLPIVLKQGKLKSLLLESKINDKLHGLSVETIKRLPEAISNPLNVLKSSTDNNSIVLITDLADKNERPIIASIQLNYEGQIGSVTFLSNRLTSAYGKDNYDDFMKREIGKGNLLYDIDKGIIKELPTSTRLQSPKGLSSSEDTINNVSSVDNSISYQNKNVKSNTITNDYGIQKSQNNASSYNIINKEQYKKLYRNLEMLKREADKITRKINLTDKESVHVDRLLSGEIEISDLPKNVNKNDIIQVFNAKKPYYKARQLIDQYKKKIVQNRINVAKDLIVNADNWKDKKLGFQYSRETAKRNIYDIMPKEDADKIYDTYFRPYYIHEAQATRDINRYIEIIEELNIGTADKYKINTGTKVSESALVQMFGENRITLEELQKTGVNVEKIENATKIFRSIYDELFDKLNEASIENGYAPIEKKKDYFPHFVKNTPDTMLGKIASKFGIDTTNQELPTDIAGITAQFKPGRKWMGNLLHRYTDITDFDVLKGFDNYVRNATDIIYHTTDIKNLRALNNAIRYNYSDKGIQEKINSIKDDNSLDEFEKVAQIQEMFENKDTTHLSKFVTWLNEYTNSIAGKKSMADRNWEYNLGRNIYSTMANLESKISANMIARKC